MTKKDYSYILNEQIYLIEQYRVLATDEAFKLLCHTRSMNRYAAGDVLIRKGGNEVLDRCLELLKESDNYRERETSAYVLGQIEGLNENDVEKVIPALMSAAEKDSSYLVKAASIIALHHLYSNFSIDYGSLLPLLFSAAKSPSVNVRFSVAVALVSENIQYDVRSLLEMLLTDSSLMVRDWAGLAANFIDADSPAIREALVAMFNDKRKDGRIEAIMALAKRHDPRVVPELKYELSQSDPLDDAIRAAADLEDPQFIPILEELLERFDDPDNLIQSSLDRLKALK